MGDVDDIRKPHSRGLENYGCGSTWRQFHFLRIADCRTFEQNNDPYFLINKMPGKAGGTVKPLKKGKTEGKDLSAEDIA